MIISQHGETAGRPLTFIDRFDRVAKQTQHLDRPPLGVCRRRLLRPNLGDNWPVPPLR